MLMTSLLIIFFILSQIPLLIISVISNLTFIINISWYLLLRKLLEVELLRLYYYMLLVFKKKYFCIKLFSF